MSFAGRLRPKPTTTGKAAGCNRLFHHLAMGQKPESPLKYAKMGVVHLPQNSPIGFDPQPFGSTQRRLALLRPGPAP